MQVSHQQKNTMLEDRCARTLKREKEIGFGIQYDLNGKLILSTDSC